MIGFILWIISVYTNINNNSDKDSNNGSNNLYIKLLYRFKEFNKF